MILKTPLYSLSPSKGGWRYRLRDGRSFDLAPPLFEVDGRDLEAKVAAWTESAPARRLPNGVREHLLEGQLSKEGLSLELRLRLADDSPILRLQYRLRSEQNRRLTKRQGRDRLRYLGFKLPQGWAKEVRLSEWLHSIHSFNLSELDLPQRQFEAGGSAFGPILAAGDGTHALLAAYEHGSTVPDDYLRFRLFPDRRVELEAVKGNYLRGQSLAQGEDYTTLWLQFGALKGGLDDLAGAYRHFVLHRFSQYAESRKPYVCYNTWNHQEHLTQAGRHFNRDMNSARMLKEAKAASKIGVEVFVVDTGWFSGSGDWRPHPKRFPDGMRALRRFLESKGMKLGVWFSPQYASVQSEALAAHQDCVATQAGKRGRPWGNWDSQPSHLMCFASRYWESFAERLIAIHQEMGVKNFKWDAVGQYGCDDPGHLHGDGTHSARERAEAFSFQIPLRLVQVVERLQEACPDAVVDFDITETSRAVGLAWLSVSRYYLFNNGPYYQDFDHELPKGKTWNLFFNPGPARGWMARAPLAYDRWLPSSALMWHFIPDDPAESELMNLASLALGPGGLWSDLPAYGAAKVRRMAAFLRKFKAVRADISEAGPAFSGRVGGSPEVHEKISARGRGAVMVFADQPGAYDYVSKSKVKGKAWCSPGLKLRRDKNGRVLLRAEFKRGEYAKAAFFGI